jgi:hypothetical protein
VAGDFEKRRAAAGRQSRYRRRRRLGLIPITLEVLPPDVIAAGQPSTIQALALYIADSIKKRLAILFD